MTNSAKPIAGQGSAQRIGSPQSIPERSSRAKHLRLELLKPLLARASRVARSRMELAQDHLAASIASQQRHVSDAENDQKPHSFTTLQLATALRTEGLVREWAIDQLHALCSLAGGRYQPHVAAPTEEPCVARLSRIMREAAEVTCAIAERVADGQDDLSELEHEHQQTREAMAVLAQHEAFLARAIAKARGLR